MTAFSRREILTHISSGALFLGLRSMVTGVPPAILLNPRSAAAVGLSRAAAAVPPQFVIYSTSGMGDPINANAPGTYDDPLIVHAQDPAMAAANITQSSVTRKGAAVWNTLPQAMLDKTAFFHHGTYTIIHTEESKVIRLMGAVNKNDMLPCMMARELATSLGTISAQPLCLYGDLNAALVDNGVPLPMHPPSTLNNVLGVPRGLLGSKALMNARDKSLDKLNAWAKSEAKTFQKGFLDQYALSQEQARNVQDKLGNTLANIKDNEIGSQVSLALALFQLNLTAVAAVSVPFGGDNHGDQGFTQFEVPQHKSGVAALADMQAKISAAGLNDQVSFLLTNVFGRNLTAKSGAVDGRGHNENHAVSLLYGPHIKGGVVGGIVPNTTNGDYMAQAIDPSTGVPSAGGSISFDTTLASMGKTFSAAAGIDDETLTTNFRSGSVVTSVVSG
jgi:hypothetical protein